MPQPNIIFFRPARKRVAAHVVPLLLRPPIPLSRYRWRMNQVKAKVDPLPGRTGNGITRRLLASRRRLPADAQSRLLICCR